MSEVAGVLLGLWYWVKEERGVCASCSAVSRWRGSWCGVMVGASAKEVEEGGENIIEAVHISLCSLLLLVDSLFFPPTWKPRRRNAQIAADLWYAARAQIKTSAEQIRVYV